MALNDIIDKVKKEYLYEKEHGDNSNIGDSYHNLPELYYQRMLLTSMVFNFTKLKDRCWKSKLHDDGKMFEGYFIVGCSTYHGTYAYHYDLKYWDMFSVEELPRAPEYDGHQPEDIGRLLYMLEVVSIPTIPYV